MYCVFAPKQKQNDIVANLCPPKSSLFSFGFFCINICMLSSVFVIKFTTTTRLYHGYTCHIGSILARTKHMNVTENLRLNCSLSVPFQLAAVFHGGKREETSYEQPHASKKSILGRDPARRTDYTKEKLHFSCGIEDFVETLFCKLCVILRSRVLLDVCPY